MAKTSKVKKSKKAPSEPKNNEVAPHTSHNKRVSALGKHMERAKNKKEQK